MEIRLNNKYVSNKILKYRKNKKRKEIKNSKIYKNYRIDEIRENMKCPSIDLSKNVETQIIRENNLIHKILPKTLIIYAEYDYLTLQIEKFQNKVESIKYLGINHAFINLFGIVDEALDSVYRTAEFIKK